MTREIAKRGKFIMEKESKIEANSLWSKREQKRGKFFTERESERQNERERQICYGESKREANFYRGKEQNSGKFFIERDRKREI